LGLTKEFSSVISIWEAGVMVPLTGDIRDGERRYEDGAYFHKTEACTDNSGKRIVYEYNGNIYLIEIPDSTTIEDLALANLPEAVRARLNSLNP
jgi:tricorn protease-like protein